jgi:hypothetical protein
MVNPHRKSMGVGGAAPRKQLATKAARRSAPPSAPLTARKVLAVGGAAPPRKNTGGPAPRKQLATRAVLARLAAAAPAAPAHGDEYWRTTLAETAQHREAIHKCDLGRAMIAQLPLFSLYSQTTQTELQRTDPVYIHLEAEVMRTRGRHRHQGTLHSTPLLQVERIERICTPRLQQKYLAELQDIAGLCGRDLDNKMPDVDAVRVQSFHGLDLNEFMLFHGTDSELLSRLAKQGLDPRRGGQNRGRMFGQGSYFASSASKSDNYTVPNQQGLRCLLVARVCLGEPYHLRNTIRMATEILD